jgi:hypothetical protein
MDVGVQEEIRIELATKDGDLLGHMINIDVGMGIEIGEIKKPFQDS